MVMPFWRPRGPPRPPPARPPSGPGGFPIGIVYDTFPENVDRHGRRRLLRGVRTGRSLKMESPLSSVPVVIVYGPPLLASQLNCALRLRSACVDTEPRMRCRVSPPAGAH